MAIDWMLIASIACMYFGCVSYTEAYLYGTSAERRSSLMVLLNVANVITYYVSD